MYNSNAICNCATYLLGTLYDPGIAPAFFNSLASRTSTNMTVPVKYLIKIKSILLLRSY